MTPTIAPTREGGAPSLRFPKSKGARPHRVRPRRRNLQSYFEFFVGRPEPGRVFAQILRATPLLWLGGVLPFCTPVAIAYTFFRDRCWKHLADPAVAAWFLIAAAQGLSTTLNWGNTDEGVTSLLYRFCSAPISGWIYLGALLAIGKALRFGRRQDAARNIAWLGVYILSLGLPVLLAGFVFHLSDVNWLTPLGHLIPASLPSARFQFTAQFLMIDDLVGQSMPRLVLFYPWATCLGLAGAGILFPALTLERSKLKVFGICGAAFGLVASASRAAVVGTLIGLLLYGFLQRSSKQRPFVVIGFVTLCLCLLCAPMLSGADPFTVVKDAQSSVTDLRGGSSSGRQELYDETLKRSKETPIMGHGWQGDILEDYIPLNLGSHSTIFGLFYTGGLFTLLPFLFAAFYLALRLFRSAWKGGPQERAALSFYAVLLTMCYGECIYAFSIPVFFAFLWIGGALAPVPVRRSLPSHGRLPGIALTPMRNSVTL